MSRFVAITRYPIMSMPKTVTMLLDDWKHGDQSALDELLPKVYDELHVIASRYFMDENRSYTLQATALINEAYLKLAEQKEIEWQNRSHFLGVAAIVMRRILVIGAPLAGLAVAHLHKGNYALAEDYAEQCLAREKEIPPGFRWASSRMKVILGRCRLGQKNYEAAERVMLEGYEELLSLRGLHHPDTQNAVNQLVALYESWGKREKAEHYRNILSEANTAVASRPAE